MSFQVTTNARMLRVKYIKRTAILERSAAVQPMKYAVALHSIRKKNLHSMVYEKTPYMNAPSNKQPTYKLLNGEKVIGNMVLNDTPYGANRMKMKGSYARGGGSKEADWGLASTVEFKPLMKMQQIQVNRNILKG